MGRRSQRKDTEPVRIEMMFGGRYTVSIVRDGECHDVAMIVHEDGGCKEHPWCMYSTPIKYHWTSPEISVATRTLDECKQLAHMIPWSVTAKYMGENEEASYGT